MDEWVSGWRPSSSVYGMAAGCAAAVLPSAVAWARALLVPLQCWRVLLSCHTVFLARCCGVWVVDVCLWCSCGGVSSVHSPLVVVVGGAVVDGGAA